MTVLLENLCLLSFIERTPKLGLSVFHLGKDVAAQFLHDIIAPVAKQICPDSLQITI
jgi:hypothetical protein